MSSTAMNAAMMGAWVTAAIRALMVTSAQSVELSPGTTRLSTCPSSAPAAAPANSVGVKTPPIVPVPTHAVVASSRNASSSARAGRVIDHPDSSA